MIGKLFKLIFNYFFMKKLIGIIVILSLFIFSVSSSFALQTYVGIHIYNLTDDPAASCAGEAGYGDQGRISALSSILPDYPIYYELKNASGSMISSGNISDGDYHMSGTMYLPT